MVHRRPAVPLIVASLLVAVLALAGCGSKNTPAVCSDADALKSSIGALTDLKLDQESLSTLQDKLDQVKTAQPARKPRGFGFGDLALSTTGTDRRHGELVAAVRQNAPPEILDL